MLVSLLRERAKGSLILPNLLTSLLSALHEIVEILARFDHVFLDRCNLFLDVGKVPLNVDDVRLLAVLLGVVWVCA